jgi:hypothetical protein
MKLRVEYYYDDEVQRWGFTVPALHFVGSGATPDEAEMRAIDAVGYALAGIESEYESADDVQVGYLEVDVKPSHPARAAGARSL